MTQDAEYLAHEFLRNCTKSFNKAYMTKVLNSLGARVTKQDVEDILMSVEDIFVLGEDKYLSRAGLFTGVCFSIKPTFAEYRQRMLVLGSRCIPYVDPDKLHYSLSVFNGVSRLKTVTGSFKSEDAMDMFITYGEEFCPQLINSDPANFDYDGKSFELPSYTSLTGIDIGFLIDKYDFKYGDFITLRVRNWAKGILSIVLPPRKSCCKDKNTSTDISLLQEQLLKAWYDRVEECLLETFDLMGPLRSIDQQLMCLFIACPELLVSGPIGNFNDFLKSYSSKVEVSSFGVESRLWRKGEDVPAVGQWNRGISIFDSRLNEKMKDYPFVIPEFVIDEYIRDMYFNRKNDIDALCEIVFSKESGFNAEMRKKLKPYLEERDCRLKNYYNWFEDQTLGSVRNKALELYSRVIVLIHDMDYASCDLESLPQAELTTLSQIHNHLLQVISSIHRSDYNESEVCSIISSIEGMSLSFEDLEGPVRSSLREQIKGHFKVE